MEVTHTQHRIHSTCPVLSIYWSAKSSRFHPLVGLSEVWPEWERETELEGRGRVVVLIEGLSWSDLQSCAEGGKRGA